MNENKLIEHYIHDLQKTPLNKKERAEIITQYIEKNQISIREFARKFNLHHTTVMDWLLFKNIESKEWKEAIEKGFTTTQLYRNLRNHKKTITYNELEITIDEMRRKIVGYREKLLETTPHTNEIIEKLIQELKQLQVKITLDNKKGINNGS